MTVKVTGYQWMWKYEYLGEGVELHQPPGPQERRHPPEQGGRARRRTIRNYLLDVDNALVLPADTKIRFVITADDVIHAWWVPALGWKQDAIPGIVNEAWTDSQAAGHLPRPVRRAVRQGPRLHADRRQGRAQGRIRQPGWPSRRPRTRRRARAAAPASRAGCDRSAPAEAAPAEAAPAEATPTEAAPADAATDAPAAAAVAG